MTVNGQRVLQKLNKLVRELEPDYAGVKREARRKWWTRVRDWKEERPWFYVNHAMTACETQSQQIYLYIFFIVSPKCTKSQPFHITVFKTQKPLFSCPNFHLPNPRPSPKWAAHLPNHPLHQTSTAKGVHTTRAWAANTTSASIALAEASAPMRTIVTDANTYENRDRKEWIRC